MKNYRAGISLVFATALISGFSIFFNAYGVSGINPTLFAGLKNLSVGLILVGVLLIAKEWSSIRSLSRKDWLRLSTIGLIGGSIPFVLFFNGLSLTEPGKAGFIHKLLFIAVSLLAVKFLKEHLTKYIWLGLGVLLIGQILFLGLIPESLVFGDLLILGAVLFWAVEIILSKRTLATLSPNLVAAGRMFFGGLFIWMYLLMSGNAGLALGLSSLQIQWTVITSLLLLAYVLTFYHGLQRVPAHTATAVLTLGAPITLLLQALFLDKSISLLQVAGIGIMAIGLSAILSSSKKVLSHERVLAGDHH